jgi:hypothetical protein
VSIIRLIIFLILFYVLFKAFKYFIRYLNLSSGDKTNSFKNIHPSDKYKNVEEAKFTEIKDEEKKNDK